MRRAGERHARSAFFQAPCEIGHDLAIVRISCRVDEREILAWARANMANYKAPRRVHVVDALPLNANGKVRKDLLRERARAASSDPAR